ncbi:MAG: hypothetical protein A4E32_01975 [Methanomassiliicoccales archaeon PtaU1.Bin124]|nr:MAG: hypothetical protein A4E32_01975 [Methanomassiliicoccales archaeon PtaU1.Bin124]
MEMDRQEKPNNEGTGRKKSSRGLIIAIIAIIVVALLVVSAFALTNNKPKTNDAILTKGVTEVNMTTLSIPLASISQTATWYEYNVSGANVRFFAVMDGNGTIHMAFDECPVCYDSGLGFRQSGSEMVENCCEMPYAIDSITADNSTGDGCHLISLAGYIEGDQMMIKKSTLTAQRFLFLATDEAANVSMFDATHIQIPLSGISQNATWYQYSINGTAIRFFAVKDTQGVIHTSMDICPKCYKKHAGFRQQDEINMVENCCNMAFKIGNITKEGCNITACHPAYIPNQIIGDYVVIAISDLQAGLPLFVKT